MFLPISRRVWNRQALLSKKILIIQKFQYTWELSNLRVEKTFKDIFSQLLLLYLGKLRSGQGHLLRCTWLFASCVFVTNCVISILSPQYYHCHTLGGSLFLITKDLTTRVKTFTHVLPPRSILSGTLLCPCHQQPIGAELGNSGVSVTIWSTSMGVVIHSK